MHEERGTVHDRPDWREPNLLRAHVSAKRRRIARLERELAATTFEVAALEHRIEELQAALA